MNYFNQLTRKYKSVLYFCLILSFGAYFLVFNEWVKPLVVEKDEKLLQLVVVIGAGFSVVMGFRQFNKTVLALRSSIVRAPEKLKEYRKALLNWWGMLAMPIVLSIAGFLLTSTYSFFILACFIIGILGMFMPRKATIGLLLKLTEQELMLLDEII